MNNRFSHFSLFSKLGILIFLMIPAVQSLQAQTIYYVNAAAPGGGDGTSWNNAIADLQIALDNACQHTPSSLWVAQGIYYPIQNPSDTSTGPLDRTNTFLLCNGVSIYGGFAGTENSIAERDWSTYLTVLSGDIDHNDSLSNNTF